MITRRWAWRTAGLSTALLLGLAPSPAQAQDPAVAPVTSLSDGGRVVSGAGKTLTASQVQGLDPAGQQVTVTGNGYDVNKGVYVTVCVLPPTNLPPTPCGGGQDRSGASDDSTWISSNAPDYAAGLTTPYGAGGSFQLTLTVDPKINDTLDCLSVRCAIVTRNDHTRGTDRSQDLFLPISFAAASPAPGVPTTTPPPVVTTTTVAVVDPASIPPAVSLAPDGRSVSDGVRTLTVSDADDLTPEGADVTVTGSGFDPAHGVYVALCAIPALGTAPGPCTAGEPASAWISSHPPEYGQALAVPYADGGTFSVELTVEPVIDADTDCRKAACALATRSDDTAPADRRYDLLVPIAFGEPTAEAEGDDVDRGDLTVAESDDDGGGSGTALALAGAGAAVLLVGGVAAVRLRGRSARSSDGTA